MHVITARGTGWISSLMNIASPRVNSVTGTFPLSVSFLPLSKAAHRLGCVKIPSTEHLQLSKVLSPKAWSG